jgi:hypothetical protein
MSVIGARKRENAASELENARAREREIYTCSGFRLIFFSRSLAPALSRSDKWF